VKRHQGRAAAAAAGIDVVAAAVAAANIQPDDDDVKLSTVGVEKTQSGEFSAPNCVPASLYTKT